MTSIPPKLPSVDPSRTSLDRTQMMSDRHASDYAKLGATGMQVDAGGVQLAFNDPTKAGVARAVLNDAPPAIGEPGASVSVTVTGPARPVGLDDVVTGLSHLDGVVAVTTNNPGRLAIETAMPGHIVGLQEILRPQILDRTVEYSSIGFSPRGWGSGIG